MRRDEQVIGADYRTPPFQVVSDASRRLRRVTAAWGTDLALGKDTHEARAVGPATLGARVCENWSTLRVAGFQASRPPSILFGNMPETHPGRCLI
jgi:hypothetical protein